MTLENSTDNVVQAALILAVGGTNYDLAATLQQDAITGFSVTPVPLTAMEAQKLPWLNVYRITQREESPSDYDFQERVTLRFDYYLKPTSPNKRNDRWDLLAAVYNKIYLNLKTGCHPQVSDGLEVLKVANVVRYEINTASVRYLFASDGGSDLTYPSFQAQMDFIVWSEAPDGWVTEDELSDFGKLLIDWQLLASGVSEEDATDEINNSDIEAQDQIEPETE